MTLSLPLLGMGTWGMGGMFTKDPSNFDESVELLRYGLGLGLRLIDVAELHGAGLTERIVGEAVKGFPREELTIVTKVSREHLKYDDVLRAAEGSLRRLGTEYIDLYLVHKLPPSVTEPSPETFRAFERLLTGGTVRHIGVSNFTARQIEQASVYLESARLEANEIEYNLLFQQAGSAVISFCRKNDMRVIAHRPLGKGILFIEPIPLLSEVAEKYGKTPAQVALNWIMSQDITAIPKAGSRAYIQENLGALGWKMEPEDVERLRNLDGFFPYEKIRQ